MWPCMRWSGRTARPDDVPGPHQAFPGLRLGPAPLFAQVLDESGKLRGGGHVADEHAAGDERLRDRVEVLPRGEHVEHHPVDGLGYAVVRMHVREPEVQLGGDSPKKRSTLLTACSAWSARTS